MVTVTLIGPLGARLRLIVAVSAAPMSSDRIGRNQYVTSGDVGPRTAEANLEGSARNQKQQAQHGEGNAHTGPKPNSSGTRKYRSWGITNRPDAQAVVNTTRYPSGVFFRPTPHSFRQVVHHACEPVAY